MDEAGSRAAFRRWARENHPDVGGDPELFAAGVRAVREGRWEQFVARGQAQTHRGPGDEEPETRAQVYVRKSARGVIRLYVRARRWNDRRNLPPRVR